MISFLSLDLQKSSESVKSNSNDRLLSVAKKAMAELKRFHEGAQTPETCAAGPSQPEASKTNGMTDIAAICANAVYSFSPECFLADLKLF